MFALVLRPFFTLRPPALVRRPRRVARDAAAGQPRLDPHDAQRFRDTFLPLLDAAYAYARSLTRDPTTAEDLVQDAYLRACRGFRGYRGGESKAWLFAIIRSTFLTNVRRDLPWSNRADPEEAEAAPDPADTAEARLLRSDTELSVRAAVEALPEPFREAIVLRELQELSYRDIAGITGAPIGTVMSRLARARALLAASLRLEDAP